MCSLDKGQANLTGKVQLRFCRNVSSDLPVDPDQENIVDITKPGKRFES